MAIKPRSNSYFVVTTDDDGDILAIGPGGDNTMVSTLVVQLAASFDFSGSFAVVGRSSSPATNHHDDSYVPVPFRTINLNGAASDYSFSTAAVPGTAIIQIPSNGLAIGLLAAVASGTCAAFVVPLQGSSAI